jgi:glycerol kinase
LEAIGYRVRDVLGLMAQDAGMTLEYVHGDGGAVSNRFLMQFVSDVTRTTVRASTLPELSALGAVLAGMLEMGIHASLDALEALPQAFADYTPGMDVTQAENYYASWLAAVRQILS